ncbi:putative N-acetyltransferase, MSMEG_0567 N-terminal domain family [Solimonas aquatica]|uniref:Putative N-acetyltransferase, MSMEG_0567 N-terminal domain family n=1 Tax=Solimonas aquatica TaxID=489703 RepID=A0A1H9KDP7_9GAMM|nr:MSMEG_0567/Sll0786 family nitrogen starvation N-acetyltransferase [Solimonas aquatica]SEQ97202.1 putative N-acetyltransferase, MSMEG_0567 N-terminal domain family [Solimonas aquatica]
MQMPNTVFMPGAYLIKEVDAGWERAACAALRREVFCREQQVFEHDDRDAIDEQAIVIAAIACVAGIGERVVGTVRIHRADPLRQPGLWQGSRLAVQQDYRRSAWLGSELIRHAVGRAHARGCTRFLAQVQVQNVKLFQRLHWQGLEAISVQNRPHVLMQAQLEHYPPRHARERCFYTQLREAA